MTRLVGVRLTGTDPRRRLLVVGPSLGTSVTSLWGRCADLLAEDFDVLGWELPGHGEAPPASGPFDVADLADDVVALAAQVSAERGHRGEAFVYAGDSLGGAVGQQLLLDHPSRVTAAILLCTAAHIGTAQGWAERAATVRADGTAAVVDGSRQRWFAPGFADREPGVADALLDELRAVDDESYALACEALARFDVTATLRVTGVPVVAVAGAEDTVAPPAAARAIADATGGRFVELDDSAHLAPAEDPVAVAELIRGVAPDKRTAGAAERRAVLGDAHVDRAAAATTGLTADFQSFITEYAWGGIWARPVLDRRERSLITITALVAGGHLEELAMHVRAARTNGLTPAEIAECVLQTAVYCGVPAANAALRVVQRVLEGEQ